ncbi:MAG: carboxypeptidase-like regulatory domain-containing protein [Bacteroidales bacterium]
MKKILMISYLLLIGLHCFPQKLSLNGFVKDAITLKPIKGVNIQIANTTIGTTTDDSGFFSFATTSPTANLVISHISYEKKQYRISHLKNKTEILLTPLINELKEVTINSEPINSITKKLPIYVIDYLIIENTILLLAYNHKRVNDTRLYLIDYEANILKEKRIEKAEALFVDCFEDIYFINKNEAVKIEINSNEIALIDTIGRNDFDAYNKAIDFKINDNIYYHTFHYQNFVMKLHCINLFDEEKENRTLFTITDSCKIDIFEREFNFFYYAKRALQYGLSVNSVYKYLAELRNAQSLDWVDLHGRFSPLRASIIRLKDNICVFNSTTNTIEMYSAEGRMIQKSKAKFISDKNYTGKIIKDESKKKVYAIFKDQSIILLKEVDLVTGELKPQISFPDFPYIENIKISGNQVYFLYKKKLNEELKQLYTLAI